MKVKFLSLFLLGIFCISSCDKNESDDILTPDNGSVIELPGDTITEQRVAATTILTNDEAKTWKITEASLTNDSGTFDITQNFNTQDDEFIFSGTATTGLLEWRKANDFKVDATTQVETLLDYYRSPETSSFSFNSDSATLLTALDGRLALTIMSDTNITGSLAFIAEDATITFTLQEKTVEDYSSVPASLEFTEVSKYYSKNVSNNGLSMIGSQSLDCFYIGIRERPAPSEPRMERINRFDVSTSSFDQEIYFNTTQGASKKLVFFNNELYVVGSNLLSKYNPNLTEQPISTEHGVNAFSRNGITSNDDVIYTLGGRDFIDADVSNDADILKIKVSTDDQFTLESKMPEARSGADGAFANDKLYIFGGTEELFGTEPTNTIFIYDLAINQWQTLSMSHTADYTYVHRKGNLLYVGSKIIVRDQNSPITVIDWQLKIGVFNIDTNEYEEIPTNLDGEFNGGLHSMTVVGDTMYIINGYGTEEVDGVREWSVMAADLN